MNNTGLQSFARKIAIFFAKYRPLIVLLLIVFILRIPSLFEPHRYADEEIYLTLGQAVRKGLVLYRDIHDNKPPLLYLTAAVAGNLFWFRSLLLVAHAFGVIFFWKLAELIFRNNRVAVFISSSLFGLLSTLPTLEGNIANGENFMIVPALLGTLLFYRILVRPDLLTRLWIFFGVGFLFSTSFLFKVPIVFDFLSLVLFWCFFVPSSTTNLRVYFQRVFSFQFIAMVLGFVLPIALSIAYYSIFGAFEPYVRSALLQNVGYVSSWRGGGGLLTNPLVFRGAIVGGVLIILFVLSNTLSLAVRFVSVWTVFSMYGSLLSSRPYPHYLLEALVPVSLLVVLVFVERRLLHRLFPLLLMILVLFAYVENGFWYYATVPYYRNFVLYALGGKDWEAYIDWFGARRAYAVSSYLQQHTLPTDRIFVWGTEPSIYALSDRLPVGRYAVSYHIVDFRSYDETVAAFRNSPPLYIIVIDSLEQFIQLKSFLQQYYILETTVEGVPLYRHLPETQASSFHRR